MQDFTLCVSLDCSMSMYVKRLCVDVSDLNRHARLYTVSVSGCVTAFLSMTPFTDYFSRCFFLDVMQSFTL